MQGTAALAVLFKFADAHALPDTCPMLSKNAHARPLRSFRDTCLDVFRFRAVHKFIVFHLKPRHLVNLQLQSRRSIAASPMQHPQRSQRTLLAR